MLTVLLFVVSLLLYGTIMAVMPASYRYTLTTNYTEQLSQLITDLEHRSVDDATQKIYEFCINHNAGALLSGNETSLTFGKEILDEQEQDAFQTASTALALADGTYTLQIMMSARTVNQLTEAFWRLIPIIGIVVLAISLIVSCFVTRLLTKPILEISDISKRLTTLDMTWRCNTSRTDEVGTLALNLNTMAARLDSTLKELSAANEKLQADIEQERRLEKLRVDFFQAVSHELKTPIASIQVCLETIESHPDMDRSKREEFIRRALENCHRLRSLLTDVATITRMEDGFNHIEKSPVNLSAIIQECFDDARHKAPYMEFEIDIPANIIINGNHDILKSIFSNLLDNAMAYSGGNKVTLCLTSESPADYSFSFADNGSGVENRHIQHLFERFYRVDKGRSRSAGGTGLGLAIVKNAVIFHDGHITVRNRHGGGLEFDFTLSK